MKGRVFFIRPFLWILRKKSAFGKAGQVFVIAKSQGLTLHPLSCRGGTKGQEQKRRIKERKNYAEFRKCTSI